MNKKMMIWVGSGIFLMIVVVVGAVLYENNKDESANSLDEIKKEQEEEKKDVDKLIKEFKGDKEGVMTKEEMEQVILEYEEEEDLDVNDEEDAISIRLMLEEEHGEANAWAFESGKLIGEGTSEEDATEIARELYTYGKSLKEISNPIERGHESSQVNESKSMFGTEEQRESMIETLSLDDFNPHHYKDTDGFLELSDGLKIGYFETTWRGHDSAELKNTIQFWLLVEKDIKVEDLRKELDKSD